MCKDCGCNTDCCSKENNCSCPGSFKVRIELNGEVFEFESPDASTMPLTLALLENTFGKFDAKEIAERYKELSKELDLNS